MKIRAVQYLFSDCLYQQAIFKGMDSVFLSVLTATHFYYFATVFSWPCRPNNRMQVFGTSVLASFFNLEACLFL